MTPQEPARERLHDPGVARKTDDVATRLIHSGPGYTQGAPSAPPIVATSFYTSEGDPQGLAYGYARDGNPTWEGLEAALGSMEEASALVFASGQAATHALILALTKGRPRLVLPRDGYYNVRRLAEMLRGRGVDAHAVDQQDGAAVQTALAAGPAVLWVETPSNPLLRVMDLAHLGALAAQAGAPMVVDNTTATAVLQQPLQWGATACLYSLTKATSGHSDLILGAVTTRDEGLLTALKTWRSLAGGIAGPFEAWLAHRSVKTLPLRVRQQAATALAVARHLASHRRVRRVYYPGTEPGTLAIAERQMRGGFGPLLSFEVDGDAGVADAVVGAARLIRPGTSFGGLESSWERRARWASETAPESLIRLSIGLEAPPDLLADLDIALAAG
ncbi:MAG: aminotransferase class I/II-fold pyridoxal phosphate-dependent enzyme [Chloroflexota bacterium]|nr:aminotransferase class I/II-fold pyridoxal phosphate-dependent enzyme [Chloroflexota bacterium]